MNEPSPTAVAYRAAAVVPVVSDPMRDAVVEVRGDRIVAVGTGHGPAIDLGDCVLLPGLINCHAHLEFSDLTQPLDPPTPFPDWARSVFRYRAGRRLPVAEILRAGQTESLQHGTTVVADIATEGWTPEAFDPAGPAVIGCHEVIGLSAERRQAGLQSAGAFLAQQPAGAVPRYALSPHAPYSVHPELFRELIALARQQGALAAMHLGETPEERELLDRGTGGFVNLLGELGVWQPGLFPRPEGLLEYLRDLAMLPRALVVHGNFLTGAEIDFLAAHPHLAVVYCPRTHARFGHPPHPWRDLQRRGIPVVVGTDGRGSNPDLSVLNELRFLQAEFPGVPPDELLAMATTTAAAALGLADRGRLARQAAADLVVVRPQAGAGESDPLRRVLDPAARVVGVMLSGRWAWADPGDQLSGILRQAGVLLAIDR